MDFRYKLYKILDAIQDAKEQCRHSVMETSIQKRLDASLKTYESSLEESYQYLSTKDSMNVMKKMNRRQS